MSAPKEQPMGSSGQVPAPSPGDPVPPSGGHDYPLTFSVDYPDRSLNRLTTAFRIFTAIPIAILAATVEGGRRRRPLRRRRHRDPRYPRRADAAIPPEVPALVVRLEPAADPLQQPDRCLRRADGRPLPVDRRGAGRSPRLPY